MRIDKCDYGIITSCLVTLDSYHSKLNKANKEFLIKEVKKLLNRMENGQTGDGQIEAVFNNEETKKEAMLVE
jgi:hypothetical protein